MMLPVRKLNQLKAIDGDRAPDWPAKLPPFFLAHRHLGASITVSQLTSAAAATAAVSKA